MRGNVTRLGRCKTVNGGQRGRVRGAARGRRGAVTQAPARRRFKMGSVRVQGAIPLQERRGLFSFPSLAFWGEAGVGVVMLSLATKELALGLELKRNSCEKRTCEYNRNARWSGAGCVSEQMGVLGFKNNLPPPTQKCNNCRLLEVRKH